MTQPSKIAASFVLIAAVLLLLPHTVAAQSGTVTDEAFLSTNPNTRQLNLNGQGISLIVAGSSAAVGSVQVGTSKTLIKFQLQSSLPPGTTATNVAKVHAEAISQPPYKPEPNFQYLSGHERVDRVDAERCLGLSGSE